MRHVLGLPPRHLFVVGMSSVVLGAQAVQPVDVMSWHWQNGSLLLHHGSIPRPHPGWHALRLLCLCILVSLRHLVPPLQSNMLRGVLRWPHVLQSGSRPELVAYYPRLSPLGRSPLPYSPLEWFIHWISSVPRDGCVRALSWTFTPSQTNLNSTPTSWSTWSSSPLVE